MNKKTLSNFFLILLVLNTFFIVFSIITVKTGTAFKQTAYTKFWQDNTYYAYTYNKEYRNLLASSDNRVEAGWIENVQTAWTTIKTVKVFLTEQNSRGSAGNLALGMMDSTIGNSFTGCPMSELNNRIAKADGNFANIDTDENCDPEKAFISSIDRSVSYDSVNNNNGGLMGMTNALIRDSSYVMDTTLDTSVYAQNMLKEVPILGDNISVNAQLTTQSIQNATTGWLTDFSLAEVFYNMWEQSRNLTYFLIIIPAVAYGFAIMFRMQINPQTQVTLMRALPRLLVVILLITFSYPIIALMVQLMKPIVDIATGVIFSFTSEIHDASYTATGVSVIYAILGFYASGFAWVILAAIGLVVLLISILRLLAATIVIMTKLALLIAFGPLVLLIGAFPGREDVIKNYFMTVGSLIFGYSAVLIMFNLSHALFFMGSLTEGGTVSFLTLIYTVVSIGILWKAPSAVKMVQQAMGVQPLLGGGEQQKRR